MKQLTLILYANNRSTDITIQNKNWTACADLPTGVDCHPRAATQWYRLLLLAAYGLAHALLCIVHGDESAVFRFLWLVTLTFDL